MIRILITCGPSYEPLDRVRRLTNLSTGRLGVMLAEAFLESGASVVCLKGEHASYRDPVGRVQVERFSTNGDLTQKLQRWARSGPFAAVFHAAALCDFQVVAIENPDGSSPQGGKIDSRGPGLVVRLSPAEKVIRHLVPLFPGAWVVGWKYEVDGTSSQAPERARQQMREFGTHACIVNGPACGSDWIVCSPDQRARTLGNRDELVRHLVEHVLAQHPHD